MEKRTVDTCDNPGSLREPVQTSPGSAVVLLDVMVSFLNEEKEKTVCKPTPFPDVAVVMEGTFVQMGYGTPRSSPTKALGRC